MSHITTVKSLTPNERNPRKISNEKRAMLAKSMTEFGDLSGIIFNRRTKQLVGGHQRVTVIPEDAKVEIELRHKKPTKTGTVAEGFITLDGERIRYREVDWDSVREETANIAANQHGGEWDPAKLSEMLLSLEAHKVDLDLLGMTKADFEKLVARNSVDGMTDADRAPALKKKSKTKVGQIWQCGNHRVMCGDSTSIQHVESLVGKTKTHLTVTDPPYNVSYGIDNANNPAGWSKSNRAILNDSMTAPEFRAFCQKWIQCIAAVNDGCIFVFGPPGPDGRIMFTELDLAFHCSTTIVWVKDSLVMGRGKYHNKYEPCWFGWNTDGAKFKDDRKLVNVWEFPRPKKSDLHPTMKPVDLIQKAIEDGSRHGEVVLDLFGGSGTTMIACEKTGRHARLMELDPCYVDVIVQRWEEFTGLKANLVAP